MAQQIQLRRDSAADWTTANPVLADGEFGVESDTGKFKIGDGATAWASLSYFTAGGGGGGGGLTDDAYGDITVSGAGTVMTITNGAVTAAKMSAAGITDNYVLTANGAGAVGWEALPGGGAGISSTAGTLAARPAAGAGNVGDLYLATDADGGQEYRSNGSAWVPTAPPVDDPRFVQNVAVPLGDITGTAEVDFSLGRIHMGRLTGNTTFTYSGKATGRAATVVLQQDGTGNHSVTWPATTWATSDELPPTVAQDPGTATAVDLLCFDGTTVIGYPKSTIATTPPDPSFDFETDLDWAHLYMARNQGFTDGQTVAPFTDQIDGDNATVTTGTPLYRASVAALNNKPAVEYTNDAHSATFTPALGTTWTVVWVGTVGGTSQGPWRGVTEAGNYGSLRNASNDWTYKAGGGTGINLAGVANGNAHLHVFEVTGTAAKVFLDGVETTGTVTGATLSGVILGIRDAHALNPGNIAAWGVLARALTPTEQADLAAYSTSEWGTP